MGSVTITYYEYQILSEDDAVLWEGLAEGEIDAFATWVAKNPHLAAIALAQRRELVAVRL